MIGSVWSARQVLVIAPHPDDESIAAWALMMRLRSAGARVKVIVVSDGGASHPGSRTWPRSRLVKERRKETLRAMRFLGLPRSAVSFLGLPDGELATCGELRRGLRDAVRRRSRPTLIIAPGMNDAHADHRAVAAALANVRRAGELRLSYRVWPETVIGAGTLRIVLKGAAMQVKRRVIRSYRTQTGIITDANAGFAMTHRHLRIFSGPQKHFAVSA